MCISLIQKSNVTKLKKNQAILIFALENDCPSQKTSTSKKKMKPSGFPQ